MGWEAPDEPVDHLGRFIENVRKLWPRYKTSDEELKNRVWLPRLSRTDDDVRGRVIQKHAATYPDNREPSWKLIYQELAAESTGGMDDVAILIMQLRRDKETEKRFANARDHEVWQYFVEAQVYPLMFGLRGRFKQDIERAEKDAGRMVAWWIDWARARMIECDNDPPAWIADVGIPERWLQAAVATE